MEGARLRRLKGFPEKIRGFHNPQPNHSPWEQDPVVLIIGAGVAYPQAIDCLLTDFSLCLRMS